MIPYLLAAVGGYLIGDSMKDSQTFADGGMAGVGNYVKIKNYPTFETEEQAKKFIKQTKPILRKELREGKVVLVYNGKEYFLADVKREIKFADGGMMAKGKKLDWRVGKGFPVYYYGYNNKTIYATQENNLTQPSKKIIDLGLVFPIKAKNFIGENERAEFMVEMRLIFPELDIVEIIEALHYDKKMADGGITGQDGKPLKVGDLVSVDSKRKQQYRVKEINGKDNIKVVYYDGSEYVTPASDLKQFVWVSDRMADGGKTDDLFRKLYNLVVESKRLKGSLNTASPDRKKDIQKKLAEIDIKINEVDEEMKRVRGFADGGRINTHSKVKLYNIDYDFDENYTMYNVSENDLPTELETTLAVLGYDPLEDGTTESQIESYVSMYGADYISDRIGYAVNSFEFEIDFDVIDDDDEFADGGETTPYVLWVSKDGQKRELYGNYKSRRAAEMAMKKLWNSDAGYQEMGNGPKSEYDKHGLWFADGGMMAKGGDLSYEDFKKGKKYINSSDGSVYVFTHKDESERLHFKGYDGIDRIFSPKKMRVKMAEGVSIADSNNQMLRSKVKEVKHHADELEKSVKPKTEVEAWVVAKAERSASDLSDITHYLDGRKNN